MTSETALRVALVVAAVGALIVVLGLLPAPVRVVCLILIAAGTMVAAPWRSTRGGGWWWILAAGAVASIVGAIVAQPPRRWEARSRCSAAWR